MIRAAVLALAALACGPKATFRLSSADTDNDREALAAALAGRELPAKRSPRNTSQKPRVFVLQAGAGKSAGATKTLVAFDLDAGRELWKAEADVQSRIWVGGDFIVAFEGKQLVARDQATGSVRWRVGMSGELVGASADRDRAYAVWREGSDQKPIWRLAAFAASDGDELWKHDAEGALGAPVAHGGVVYSPFLMQWLSLIDGKTGAQLARLRGIDEQISMVRATSRAAYFGSRLGVFALDNRAASGKRSEATYAQAKIPPQLDRTSYGVDLYDQVQLAYTAADRARVLWTSEPTESGPLRFADDSYAVHYFRYVFGFATDGALSWAYSHPRVQLVASDHTGSAIVGLSVSGEIVALDPKTGAVRDRKALAVGAGPVLGATFDADGWDPRGQGEPVATVAALVQIARDRDARFDAVKELAVASLAKLPGGEVTTELLAILADKRAAPKLKDAVVELLAQRKDPASLPVLTEQLAVHTDFIAKSEPWALAPVCKAIAALAGVELDPAHVGPALAALQSHLEHPATQTPDLVLVIAAMAAIGRGTEQPVLASHLLLYRTDEDLGADPAWHKAIVSALDAKGGPGERELLRVVAADPRTQAALAAAIKDVLANE